MNTFTQGEINDILADFTTLKGCFWDLVSAYDYPYDNERAAEQIAGQIVAAKVANGGYNKQCSTPAKN